MWHSCVITREGSILPCCFDKDADFKMGLLPDSLLQNIWKSSPYNRFRKEILANRQQHEMCRNCSEGLNFNKMGKLKLN